MMRSMFAGVSGLRNHQVKMDVLGDNISNVNTVGFKASRASFSEVFSQTLRGASAPGDDLGGSNAQQVGLGSSVAAIDVLQQQGSLQTTGRDTDMAIEGEGFFILREGEQTLYSRAGDFQPDADGYLVNPAGLRLQGWQADDGELPETDVNTMQDVRIPVGETLEASSTDLVVYANNLDADASEGETWSTPVEIFDSQGGQHTINVEFEKTANNEWSWTASYDSGDIDVNNGDNLEFDEDGRLEGHEEPVEISVEIEDSEGNEIETVDVDLDFSGVTQFSADSTVSAVERTGYPMGTLESFTVDDQGRVTGVYSNGRTRVLAQVASAAFSNPGGLTKEGGGIFAESNNSGLRQVGPPGTASRGTIAPGALEMSNVDLAEQFTEMISTQRGFQANSRIITTSDEMLNELVNMKR